MGINPPSHTSYNNLSGHPSLIGEKTGKVLKTTPQEKSHADSAILLNEMAQNLENMIAGKIGKVLQSQWSQMWQLI